MKLNPLLFILGLSVTLGGNQKETTVRQVEFRGNQLLPDRDLSKITELKAPRPLSRGSSFDQRILRLDAITLKNYYLSQGFLDVAVRDSFARQDDLVDIYYLIDEGRQYRLTSVTISGNTLLSEKRITSLLGLRRNKPYNLIQAKSSLSLLEREYHRYGKLFATVHHTQSLGDSVEVRLTINEGPDVYIHSRSFDGTGELDSAIVFRELLFQPGDRYNQDRIDQSKKQLLETGLFSLVSIQPESRPDNDSTINVNINLRRFKRVDQILDIGYWPFRISDGMLPIAGMGGSVEWLHRSLFGTTNRISARSALVIPLKEDFFYPGFRLDVSLSNQWFLNYRLPTRFKGFYYAFNRAGKDFILRYGLELANRYRFDSRSYLELGLLWEQFNESEVVARRIEQRKIRFQGQISSTNNPLFPRQGSLFIFDLTSVGGPLGGSRSFQKFDLDLRHYIPTIRKMVIAARINYGMIFNWQNDYDESEEFVYDKFYLGGSTSLRAWKPLRFLTTGKDPQGQTVKLLTNLEIRFPIFWILGGEVFLDGGYLSAAPDPLTLPALSRSISIQNLSWDVGTGLTVTTPLGPVRLDYAYQLDRPERKELLLGVLYAF